MLDLNITLLFQLANFFIALYVLNLLLIKPVRDIIKKRQGIMDDICGEADGFEAKAAASLSTYEAQLAQARKDATQNRETARIAALAEQQNVITAAQQKGREILEATRRDMQAQAQATLAELRQKVQGLSESLVTRLLATKA